MASLIRRAFVSILLLGSITAAEQANRPRRIVSASPNATEIIYGVGAFDRVIAVSDYCTYPPAVEHTQRIGGWENPNLERLTSLHPDLVVLTDAQAPLVEDRLKQLNLRTLIIPTRSVEDAFRAMQMIGQAVGHEAQAAELVKKTRQSLDEVRARVAGRPRKSVLLVVDRTPGTLRDLYAATAGGFLEELIEIAGGKSVTTPVQAGYGRLSQEAILTLNPEVIIDMVHGSTGRFAEKPDEVWRDLPELQAVRRGQIYPIRDQFVPHCSQFIGYTAGRFARIIHSEVFQTEKQSVR
jgi:iron complex transport system substrate-binding protein